MVDLSKCTLDEDLNPKLDVVSSIECLKMDNLFKITLNIASKIICRFFYFIFFDCWGNPKSTWGNGNWIVQIEICTTIIK